MHQPHPGEETRRDAVAAEAIEAEPAAGQIRPSRGGVGRIPDRPDVATWRCIAAGGGRDGLTDPSAPARARLMPHRRPNGPALAPILVFPAGPRSTTA